MKLLLDEHFSPAVAEQLQQRGYDVVAVAERVEIALSPLRRRPDDELLRLARQEQRVLVTENVRDFMPLHRVMLSRGESHAGILLTSPRRFPRHADAFGLLVDALAAFLADHASASLDGSVAWLSATVHRQP